MTAALYARVSTSDQTCENQLLELRRECIGGTAEVSGIRPQPIRVVHVRRCGQHTVSRVVPWQRHEIVLAPGLAGDLLHIGERPAGNQHLVVPPDIGLCSVSSGNLLGSFTVVLARRPLAY